MVTTIQLEEKVKNELNSLKNHPRESFNQVVSRLIVVVKEGSKLSDETIKNIKESIDEIKAGEYYPILRIVSE